MAPQKEKKCVLTCCKSRKTIKTRMFPFPKDDEDRRIWMHVLDVDENTLQLRGNKVCERHFEAQYIDKDSLTANAVPTLCLPSYMGIKNQSNTNVNSQKKCHHKPIHDCGRCERLQETKHSWKTACDNLIKEIVMLQQKDQKMLALSKNARLQLHTEKKLRQTVLVARKRYRMSDHLRNVKHLSQGAKTLCSMLLGHTQHWEGAEKSLAVQMYAYSSDTYKLMRDSLKMHLPSQHTISLWSVV